MRFFLIILLFLSTPAFAAVERYAVIVGNNEGGLGKVSLKYAENDAQNMYQVLLNLGQFKPENMMLITGRDAPTTMATLGELKKKIQKTGSTNESLFVFYYSGHADNENLRMGRSILALQQLKNTIKLMPATVKIAILDACQSGELTRLKGGIKAAPFEVVIDDNLQTSGEAYISSSTALEASQESEELAASYFSYFFAVGLRGAADLNKDSKVSLHEAYEYAYQQTVEHSTAAIGPVQHPSFQYDLRGKGEIILTDLNDKSSYLIFPENSAGDFFVYDKDSKTLVAELNKKKDEGIKLAVAQGIYTVKKKEENKLYEKDFLVPFRGEVAVTLQNATVSPYKEGTLKRTLYYNYSSLPQNASDTSAVTLQAGDIIKVRLLENLSAKTSDVGEKISLECATDVYVNGIKIIKAGAPVVGEVIAVKPGSPFPPLINAKGFLKIAISYVQAINGQMIPLKSTFAKKGRGGKMYNPKFVRSTEFDTFVEKPTVVSVN